MAQPSNRVSEVAPHSSGTRPSRLRRRPLFATVLAVLAALSLAAGYLTARKALPSLARESGSAAALTPSAHASPARLPEGSPSLEIRHLVPQQQAELLLERAILHDQASLNLLRENVDGWRGRLQNTDRLFDLVLTALNSSDLRVRTAAVDVDLAASNLSKSPQTVARLLRQLPQDASGRGMTLWRLGSLGNRGVEPERVLSALIRYSHDRSEHTRYWAVEGLAMLGSDTTLDTLLDLLAHDPSPSVRERAACSLAKSGLFTREQRLAAVPPLLNFTDDDSLHSETRELVYGALRTITGAALGNDPSAWRTWWAGHDPAHEPPRQRPGTLLA
jgi:hypothetical protein